MRFRNSARWANKAPPGAGITTTLSISIGPDAMAVNRKVVGSNRDWGARRLRFEFAVTAESLRPPTVPTTHHQLADSPYAQLRHVALRACNSQAHRHFCADGRIRGNAEIHLIQPDKARRQAREIYFDVLPAYRHAYRIDSGRKA